MEVELLVGQEVGRDRDSHEMFPIVDDGKWCNRTRNHTQVLHQALRAPEREAIRLKGAREDE